MNKKKLIIIFAIVLVAGLAFSVIASNVNGQAVKPVEHVLDTAIEKENDLSSHTYINVKPGEGTLKQAVEEAKDGDTLILESGCYKGDVTIDKNLSIEGVGVPATEVMGSLKITANKVSLKNFATSNAEVSEFVYGKDVDSMKFFDIESKSDVTFENVRIWQIARPDANDPVLAKMVYVGNKADGSKLTFKNCIVDSLYDTITIESSNTTLNIEGSSKSEALAMKDGAGHNSNITTVASRAPIVLKDGKNNTVNIKNCYIQGRSMFDYNGKVIQILDQENLNVNISGSIVKGAVSSSNKEKVGPTSVFYLDEKSSNVTINLKDDSKVEDAKANSNISAAVFDFGEGDATSRKNKVVLEKGTTISPVSEEEKYRTYDEYVLAGITDEHGVTTIEAQKKNSTIKDELEKIEDGIEVDGWYTDSKLKSNFVKTTPLRESLTVYPKCPKYVEVQIGDDTFDVKDNVKVSELSDKAKAEIEKLKTVDGKEFSRLVDQDGNTVTDDTEISNITKISARYFVKVNISGIDYKLEEKQKLDNLGEDAKKALEALKNAEDKTFAKFLDQDGNIVHKETVITKNITITPRYSVEVKIGNEKFELVEGRKLSSITTNKVNEALEKLRESVIDRDFIKYVDEHGNEVTLDTHISENIEVTAVFGDTLILNDKTFEITKLSNTEYTGKEIKPEITVKYNDGKVLEENKDYTVKYENNLNAGNAKVALEGKGSYKGSVERSFEILPKGIGKLSVSDIGRVTYTGEEIKPEVVIKDGEKVLTASDYKVVYESNVNVGMGRIIVNGTGNYQGTFTKYFDIVAKNASTLTIENMADLQYTGAELTPKVVVKDNGKVLDSSNYTYRYINNVNVGKGIVQVTGKRNYAGTVEKTFNIVSKPISSGITIKSIPEETYTGQEIKPKVQILKGTKKLEENVDYTLSYGKNIDVGTAVVYVTGKGNYNNQVTVNFKILPKSISNAKIDEIASAVYTGNAITPSVRVNDAKEVLSSGEDYKVTYTNNINAGTATVTVKGLNNYTGTSNKTFKITPRNVNNVSVQNIDAKTYNGSSIAPKVNVTDNGKSLSNNQDYSLSYKDNDEVGRATVTIKGKGNYQGSYDRYFYIVPGKVSNLKVTKTTNNSVSLTWNRMDGVDGYEIYKLNSRGTYEYVTSTTSTSYTQSKLAEGTSYKYEVRGYEKISGVKCYGDFSNVVTGTTLVSAPATPKISKVTTKSKKATVKWGKVSGASGYELYMATSKNGKYSKIKSGNVTSYTKSKLTKKKTYYFKVRAYKKVNGKTVYSGYSSIKSIKVK